MFSNLFIYLCLDPPGEPKILNPEPKHVYTEGEELKAVCIATPPGKPFGSLFWRWLIQRSQLTIDEIRQIDGMGGHGGARLIHDSINSHFKDNYNLLKTEDNYVSEDVQSLHYFESKENDKLVNTLIIQRISRRYHASKLICETGHSLGKAQFTSIQIYVKR